MTNTSSCPVANRLIHRVLAVSELPKTHHTGNQNDSLGRHEEKQKKESAFSHFLGKTVMVSQITRVSTNIFPNLVKESLNAELEKFAKLGCVK